MSSTTWIVIVAVVVVVLAALLVLGLVLRRRRRVSLVEEQAPEVETQRPTYKAGGGFDLRSGSAAAAAPAPTAPTPPVPTAPPTPSRPVPPVERTDDDDQPRVGDDASVPRDSAQRGLVDVSLPDAPPAPRGTPTATPEAVPEPEPTPTEAAPEPEPAPVELAPGEVEVPAADTVVEPAPATTPEQARDDIAPTEGRLERLRGRLSRSQGAVGQSLLGLLGAGDLDEDAWEEVEDTLIVADLGSATTAAVVTRLREQLAVRSVRTSEQARALLKEVLVDELSPQLDRSLAALPHDDAPAVLLVVGVNGTGKTTTTGKLARVLVADGRRVLLGAADTFRAAAADQLATWADRVGAEVVRGKEGADPAAVAFDAVARGAEQGVDAVLVDTAGRLHTKTGLMDELGKVKRVIEKRAAVDEVLLVLDATTGQNGLAQARVFADVVTITGVVLTKLDGTAKGGIVFQVQRELGVPVKLVGLGEGADDLAPFEPGAFVDALLG